jgi:hypothetical protein
MALAHPAKPEPSRPEVPSTPASTEPAVGANTLRAPRPATAEPRLNKAEQLPGLRIARLTGRNPDEFVREFSQYVGRVVSPSAIATWLEILENRRMPLTKANLVAVRKEETERAARAGAARRARSTSISRKRNVAETGPKPAKKRNKRKSTSVFTVSLNDTPGIAMVTASRKKRGGGWHR